MKVEVLLSCMHQKDSSIIETSRLSNNLTLVVNQCNIETTQSTQIDELHRIICTPQRGLSNSRNMALENAIGDICIICDDDEKFCDNFEQIIINAYAKHPDADLIIFKLYNLYKKLGDKSRRLKKLDLLRVQSQQITFKRNRVLGEVAFDPLLGAGTGNGGGEENKFLLDCYKKGKKIFYVPVEIAELDNESDSTWFHGYNEKHFYDWGRSIRYILGYPLAVLYACYALVTKKKEYASQISFRKAGKAFFSGIHSKKLGKT